IPEPAPGESVPVVDAPPPPTRRRVLPGTDVSVWPLVIVGVIFAALGVSVTLWVMLWDAPDANAPLPGERREPSSIGSHPTTHPAPHEPAPHEHSPTPAPAHPSRPQQR